MIRIVLLISLFVIRLCAYSDADMDGVSDHLDRCSDTPMLELVNQYGCPIKTLEVKSEYHADLSVGIGYDKVNSDLDDETYSLNANYYFGSFSANLYMIDYLNSSNIYSRDDLYLSGYYQIAIASGLALRLGAGITLPLNDEKGNKTDYLLSAQVIYQMDKLLLYAYYKYTFMHDLYSQNIDTKMIGASYTFIPKLSTILSYSNEKSIYEGYENLEYLTIYGKYYFDGHWFGTARFSKGLSDTANDLSTMFSIGYYF